MGLAGALLAIFVLSYAAIALEEPLGISKAGAALTGAGLLWTVYALGSGGGPAIDSQLSQSLVATAQVAFFLIGAMTVVEVIDAHDGFEVITTRIRATSLLSLSWMLCTVTFFLSAVLDNLTTAIVMVSLLGKLLANRDDRLFLAGLIVISANAGGAWSPMGDVTTTMLWIGGQVTAVAIVKALFVPSLVNMAVPLALAGMTLRGKTVSPPASNADESGRYTTLFERNLMFGLGLAVLLAVPLFKAATHLPPFLGILLGLGLLWIVGDLVHRGKDDEVRLRVTIAQALTRIDMSAIVFFIGILLAVATLDHAGILAELAAWLDRTIGRLDVIVFIIGLVSAVVDNVPVVAAAIGMYDIGSHPADSFLWEFVAYCAGTGGSILIIGSAAGIAAMGIEKIDFLWYLRRFSLLAAAGYVAGALTYVAQYRLLH